MKITIKINIIVYGIRNAPPPCLKQRYGNLQTLPKPEKKVEVKKSTVSKTKTNLKKTKSTIKKTKKVSKK